MLDLDETMIHSIFNPDGDTKLEQDFMINLDATMEISVLVRPHLKEVLEKLAEIYEICVFTAGTKEYADLILDKIDPEHNWVTHRLYRHHCIRRENKYYVKDLRIISDRDLGSIILVDNSIISFAFNIDNGIPICGYFNNDMEDNELLYLYSFLETSFYQKDSLVYNKDKFRLGELMGAACAPDGPDSAAVQELWNVLKKEKKPDL